MLGQQTDSGERGDEPREQRDSRGLVGQLLPFAAAFVAGFLLGSRREGDEAESSDGGVGGVTSKVKSRAMSGSTPSAESADAEGATDQPSSMGSVAGEHVRERERDDESTGETGESTGGTGESTGETGESTGETGNVTPDEIDAVEAPTTRGMPMLGLGTYRMTEYDECFGSVRAGLGMGYRHLDTAEGYDNEEAVGDAIAESAVDREDLFVATKVGPENLAYDHVLTAAEESLDRLGVDSLDLLYVHWPTGEYEPTDTLDAFAELREEGLIGEIGVSNFTVELLEEAVEISEEPVFANQVEMHPLLPQTELRQFCARDDVDVELVAYSPIARSDVEDVEELQDVADKHDATPAQVSLAWLREKEVTAIPKATSQGHLRENWLSLAVDLDGADVDKIDAIEERRRLVDPDEAPWNW